MCPHVNNITSRAECSQDDRPLYGGRIKEFCNNDMHLISSRFVEFLRAKSEFNSTMDISSWRRSTTRAPADFFGLQSRMGSIEPGKAEDLVSLNQDPMVDIDNVRQATIVISAGRIVLPRVPLVLNGH